MLDGDFMGQFPKKTTAGGNMEQMMANDSMAANKGSQNQQKQLGQMHNVMDNRG